MEAAERKTRTRIVAAALLLLAASLVLTRTGRDALYFQERGLFELPYAYLGILCMAVPTAFVVLRIVAWIGPRRARLLAPVAAAALLFAYVPASAPGGGLLNNAFFVFVPVAWGVLFSMAWLLGADLLEGASPDELAGAYATIGAGSIAGGLVGALAARGLAEMLAPAEVITAGALTLLAATAVMAFAQRRYPPCEAHARAEEVARRDPARRPRIVVTGYSRLLFAISVLGALAGVLVEFQFYLVAASAEQDSQGNLLFFANFYLVLNALALGVQLYLMPRLQRAVGVDGSLMVLPLVLLGGAGALLLSASGLLRSALRVAEGGIKSSIHRSSWEQVYLPVARSQRAFHKLIVDGVGARVGEGAAALLILLWLRGQLEGAGALGAGAGWITGVLAAATLCWSLASLRLGARLRALGEARPSEVAPAGAEVQVPGCCVIVATLGEGVQREWLEEEAERAAA